MNTFTVEETNLLSIYKTDDKWEMLTNMADALPLMDREMRAFAGRTMRKLDALPEAKFAALSLELVEE